MVRFLLTTVIFNSCSVRWLRQAKIVYKLSFKRFDSGYHCRRVLKLVLNPTTFFVLHANVVRML